MKQISHWSILGIVLGLSISLFSGIRYFLLYPDTDKALFYIGSGLIICAIAWLYNVSKFQDYRISAIEDYISDKQFKEFEEIDYKEVKNVKKEIK